MNQPIFVHANSKSLPPLIISSSSASDTNAQKSATFRSVGAVVRPSRHAVRDGKSVRADSHSDATVPTPHVRTNKLEDYVKWLKMHAANKRSGESDNLETTPEVLMPATDDSISEFDNYIPKPSQGFSIDSLQRVDGAHQVVKSPQTNATQFPTASELQELHGAMMSGEVVSPDVVATQPAVVFDSDAEKIPVQQSNVENVNSDDIIRTVSQAIAAVLTEQSEISIEQKLRKQLEKSMHEAALAALPPEDAQEVMATAAEPDETLTATESIHSQSPAPHFQEEVTSHEIPMAIAAWDVEDFRWPSVTNQMIVSGSNAIAQLANSVFQLMGATGRRLAITSPGRGEGTTSVAISLARWAAASGKKVLLVDADLASPGLSSQVGLGPNISWINAVSNSLAPCEVIIRSQKTPVCVMPMTPIVTRVTWPRFIYDSLGELSKKVHSSFDLIIFDVGPTSQLIAELSHSALMVDAGLIVHNGVDPASFQKARDRLQEFGVSKYLVAQNSAQQTTADVA